jgi:putative copper export protein
VREFALWLAATPPSVFIQEHNSWTIPAIQSVHIIGIGLVMGSVLMIDLRILGWSWTDQTLRQTTDRFSPWLTGALWLLLVTGVLMVVGEPVRELVTFSFWLKMLLVALSALIAVVFRRALRRHERDWEDTLVHRTSIKGLAVATFFIWTFIIVLGRLIAYDHVWGSWSPGVGQ